MTSRCCQAPTYSPANPKSSLALTQRFVGGNYFNKGYQVVRRDAFKIDGRFNSYFVGPLAIPGSGVKGTTSKPTKLQIRICTNTTTSLIDLTNDRFIRRIHPPSALHHPVLPHLPLQMHQTAYIEARHSAFSRTYFGHVCILHIKLDWAEQYPYLDFNAGWIRCCTRSLTESLYHHHDTPRLRFYRHVIPL